MLFCTKSKFQSGHLSALIPAASASKTLSFFFVKETLSAGFFFCFCMRTGVWVSLCCRFYEAPQISKHTVHLKRIIIRHKTDKITLYKIFSLFLEYIPWGDSLLQLSGNLREIKFYRERILI